MLKVTQPFCWEESRAPQADLLRNAQHWIVQTLQASVGQAGSRGAWRQFTPSCFLVHTFQVPGRFFSLFLWGSHCHQNHFRQPDKNQDLAQFQAYRITISWACQSASHKWPQVIPMPRPTTTTQGEWVMRQPRSTYPWRNPFLPPRYPEDRGPIPSGRNVKCNSGFC